MSKWPKGDHQKPYRIQDNESELRDIFAALAMQALIKEAYGSGVTNKWVAHQAYKYADTMLEERDNVSNNMENNK